MSKEMQETEQETSDELDELVKIEAKTKDFIEDKNVSDRSQQEETDILTNLHGWISENKTQIKGKVEDINKKTDQKIEIIISYDEGSFTEEMKLPCEKDTNIDDCRLVRLLKYKKINSHRFLDLRGEEIPIEITRSQSRILVPKNQNRVSNALFQILQKSREYNLVTSHPRCDKFKLTDGGIYFLASVLTPIFIGFGLGSGALSASILSSPMLSVLGVPLMFFSIISTIVGIISGAITLIITVLAGTFLFMGLIIKTVDYITSNIWPL